MKRINFSTPDPLKAEEEGLFAADCHFHTEYSMDGISHIPDVLKKAKKLRIGVAITDHNTIKGSLKAFGEKSSVTIIPGIEVTGNEGPHMIYYFYSTGGLREFWERELKGSFEKNPFFSERKTFDIIEASKDYNCVAVAPHPYAIGITGIKKLDIPKEIEKAIRGIEVINGYNLHSKNLLAQEWAGRSKIGITAGTDGHTTHELGNALTMSEADDTESFLNSILKAKTYVWGREENIFEKAVLAAVKEESYISRAHEEHKALMLIESQFSTEYNYLMKKVKEIEGSGILSHFRRNHAD